MAGTRASVPRPALVLGIAGAAPFVAGALAMLVGPGWLKLTAYVYLVNYAAVALAFVGAVHWGLALAASRAGVAVGWSWYGGSVLPALAGWVALLLIQPAPKLVLLGLGFAAVFIADVRAERAGAAPAWYPALRKPLTIVVLVSLLGALAATWRH